METANLGGGYGLMQDVLALGTDSVLLAHFAMPAKGRICDLGCGGGAVMLLMALRSLSSPSKFDGVEIRSSAAKLADENIKYCGLEDRVKVHNGDLREIKSLLEGGIYSEVVSNPPYMKLGGGIPPEDDEARIARTEEKCKVEDLCRAASWLLKYGGRFCLVYPPERLGELFRVMYENSLTPKKLRLFCRNENAAPSLALIEARKNGGEGLAILPSLYQNSAEFAEICAPLKEEIKSDELKRRSRE